MLKLLLIRLLSAIPILLLVTVIVFLLLQLVPGDAAVVIAGETASPQDIAATRERLGLNDPLPVQYGRWLAGAVQGDLGNSMFSDQSVTSLIGSRIPVTASLAVVALLLILAMGLSLGVLAAVRPNSVFDRTVTGLAALSLAVPPFLIAVVLVLVLALQLKWFPATGYAGLDQGFGEWLRHLILPAFSVSLVSSAELARQTRSGMLDVLSQDYIRTARSKGLRTRQIVVKHALKNAASPILTVFGLQVGRFLAGAVIVEFIFALPGLGSLAAQAVSQRDIPLIQGVVLFSAVAVIGVNLLVDISYGIFNPRLRD
jgi:peptide/nickel transport system permease protein